MGKVEENYIHLFSPYERLIRSIKVPERKATSPKELLQSTLLHHSIYSNALRRSCPQWRSRRPKRSTSSNWTTSSPLSSNAPSGRPLNQAMEASENFAFVGERFPFFKESATRAIAGHADPRASCFHARHALERLVIRLFKVDRA